MSEAPNRMENLRSLRVANLDGAFSTVFATLVGGAFLTGLIDYLGGNDALINLAAALPALCGLLQIPGGVLGRRFESYKKFVAPGGLGWRALYVPFIFLLFLPIPDPAKLALVITCVAMAAACQAILAPAYNEWIAELVPANSRGFFFARRNAVFAATGAIAGLGGAFLLDRLKGAGKQDLGFSIVFGVAVLAGAVSMVFYMRMHDLKRKHVDRQPFWSSVKELKNPIKDPNFRPVLLFLGVFLAGQAFAGNLFSAFAIKSLNLPYTIIQWAAVMHAFGNVLAAKFWGYLADRYGNKPVLYLVGIGLAFTPLMWLFCEPNQTVRNAAILLPIHILVGATWSGVALCQFNLLLATAKPEERANYLSVSLTVQSLVGFVAPMLGAQVFILFDQHFDQATSYKMVFGVTMLLRAFAVLLLFPVREEGALQVRKTIRDLTRLTPKGIKAMRQLSGSMEDREVAIEKIAEHKTTLAADEVIKALHDPSPRIRRQAAAALAKMDDPNAVPALLHMFADHPDLVDEEAVEALGLLGDPRAAPCLIEVLDSPVAMIRRAAAKALGRVGGPEAIEALTKCASQPGDPDLRRSSLQALRNLEAYSADLVIADALFDPAPSVRIAAAEAVAEMGLQRSLPYLRQAMNYYEDEASSELAYALGSVGDREDLELILREAMRCNSMITRRRCLLGAAKILGVEHEVYRLFMTEGMLRDQVLMQKVESSQKGFKRLRNALANYSNGDEKGALEQLAPARRFPEFRLFDQYPVEELFLVAVAVIERSNGESPNSQLD